MRQSWFALLFALLLAFGAACRGREGGNATQPLPPSVAIVEVTPSTDTLDNGIVMAGNADIYLARLEVVFKR